MGPIAKGPADISGRAWIDRVLPEVVLPYARLMRLDRPIGTWLLLLPCWWSLALAGYRWEDLWFYPAFTLGALIMRGAGCTWNDITDRDFDGRVARTRTRPIPSGDVSLRQAYIFLAAQLAAAFLILLTFNGFAIGLGVASLLIVCAYPFMKRITYWPQIVLGLAFNWGALLGWAASTGSLSAAPVLLYVAGIFWTLGYDTIYAHQDKEDDAFIGLKSTALLFGANTRSWLWIFYGMTMLLLAVTGIELGFAGPFFAGWVIAGLQLAWQVKFVDLDDPVDCLSKFKSNRYFGLILLAGVLLETL